MLERKGCGRGPKKRERCVCCVVIWGGGGGSGVGECLVGRHASGVAVDRCALFGVVRAGSVLLPGLGMVMVDRWVGHDCFTCVCCCLRPHTITPLPWRERGIQFPQHKNKHTLPKHVATRQGRHKEAGKGTYTSCSEGG
eukprot:scaffold10789_cov141-Isochrysis_galbana.AAC.1